MTKQLHDTMTVLYAAEDVQAFLYAAEAATVEADPETRNMSGLLIPYGVVGYTSAGPVVVPGPGRIDIPEDLSRVKLVRDHPTLDSFGHMTGVRDTPRGLRGAFYVGRTPLGDQALLEASERVRDAFSVELTDLELTNSGELVRGRLKAVATPIVPAWADARADGLAAAHSTTQGKAQTMTEEERARLQALLAMSPEDRTQEEADELRDLLAKAQDDAGTGDDDDDQDQGDQDQGDQGGDLQASRRVTLRRPTGNRRTASPARRPRHTLRDLCAAQAAVFAGTSRPGLEAALADITNTANIWTARDDYAGELWSGVQYERQYVGLLLPGDLPSYKGTGWRWTTRPEVADWAGDKAAVPSNTPVTEATSWQAARLAGAHDIDRKFADFGDTEFLESYYRNMTDSYAIKSDGKARAFIIANAEAAGSAGVGTTIWHAAAKAAQAVFDATGGLTPDYLLVNSADVFGLVGTASADMPDQKVLDMFGVTSDKFKITAGVAAGTVIAGVRQAGKFRELGNSPIRVEALDIVKGGVNGGVFGYYATEETFVGGIQAATFGA